MSHHFSVTTTILIWHLKIASKDVSLGFIVGETIVDVSPTEMLAFDSGVASTIVSTPLKLHKNIFHPSAPFLLLRKSMSWS